MGDKGYTGAYAKPGTTLSYKWIRIRQTGIIALLLGQILRRSITRAGFIAVEPGWPFPRIINRGGRIEVGNCRFYPGVRIDCWRGACITIGKGTYLNRNTEIIAAERVTIGVDCKIARDVIIMDTDQHSIGLEPLINKPVDIGDRVWLGSRVIILKGVTIGHDSIVGAGSIVTKSMPPFSVAVGPAAKVVRTLRNSVAE